MENENKDGVLPEENEGAHEGNDAEEITLSKAEYKKLDRKARAYDAGKAQKPQQDNSDIRSELVRLELKTEGYTDDAISFLSKNGGKEALKNPYVKAAIDAIQEQKRAEAAVIVNESSRSDIERKFTPEEISAMSPEELYKILPKAKK